MTQNEIIRMFHEAGKSAGWKPGIGNQLVINYLTRFAALVAAHEREKQAEQEPLMDYERINALREGEQNGAEDAYFFVRPENDTPSLRKMFCQGFERGFHKGLKYASHVRTKDLTDEIDRLCVAIKAEDDYCVDNGDYMLDSNDCIKIIRGEWVRPDYSLDRAVIAADREKNK